MRNKAEGRYSKSTMIGVRAGINRHLRNPPHAQNICLMSDSSFANSNRMFAAVMKKAKEEGCDKSKHTPNIRDLDLEKIRAMDAFDLDHQKQLQEKVWFDIQLHFARRGRENSRTLKASSFAFKHDDTGLEFVELEHSECTKNHPGKTTDTNQHTKARMYANGLPNCPLMSLRLYLERRNKTNDVFFQKARSGNRFKPCNETVWYTTVPLGHNTIGKLMPNISERLQLSMRYTNHCVRATTVTVLSNNGVEAREIMRITGHKAESSLRSYHTDSTDKQKRTYSALLQNTTVTKDSDSRGTTTQATHESQYPTLPLSSPEASAVAHSHSLSFTNTDVPTFNITKSVVNIHYH